jgi:PAS domain S-box-containing protein
VCEAEFRVRRYDGAYRYLLCVAAPLVGDDGGVREWVGTCVDVTERRQAVELANRVAELEAVLAAENDAVLVYGTDLNVSDANPAFLDRYGFNPVGLNVKDILDRLSCRRLDGTPFLPEEQPTLRALRGETVSGARFLITREVGPETILEISSCPMLVGGRIVGAVAVWRDVTEREHAREGLLRVRTQLEYRLHEMAETVHKALDDAEREGVDSGEPRTLTPREIEVLALVAKGKSSKTIADELLINLHTVNRHRQNLMDKLRVRKTADLVRYAISHGLVVR